MYFFRTFKPLLTQEKRLYSNVDKSSVPQLERLHRRVVGKLQAGKKGKQKVGVIVDGEEYIKKTLNEILLTNAFKGLTAKGAIVDIEAPDRPDPSITDIGTFEVKRAKGGALAYQREPIYSALPTTQEDEINAEEQDRAGKKPMYRMHPTKTKRRDLVHTARRQRKQDPFRRNQGGLRLNYMY